MQRLPFSVQQLVESSPSVTGEGAPVLGSKHTRVHYLDRATGALHNTLDPSNPAGRASASAAPEALAALRAADVLAVGRVQHTVEALNPLTGSVLWNVSHAAWALMPLAGVDVVSEPLLNVPAGTQFVLMPSLYDCAHAVCGRRCCVRASAEHPGGCVLMHSLQDCAHAFCWHRCRLQLAGSYAATVSEPLLTVPAEAPQK